MAISSKILIGSLPQIEVTIWVFRKFQRKFLGVTCVSSFLFSRQRKSLNPTGRADVKKKLLRRERKDKKEKDLPLWKSDMFQTNTEADGIKTGRK